MPGSNAGTGFVPPRTPERVRADAERERWQREHRGPLLFAVCGLLLAALAFALLVWLIWLSAFG